MYWRVNSVLEQNPKIWIYNKEVEKLSVFSNDTEYLWYVCTMAQTSIASVIERIKSNVNTYNTTYIMGHSNISRIKTFWKIESVHKAFLF